MDIREVKDKTKKREITRLILENLTEWFGILEAREEYIRESGNQQYIAAYYEGEPIGFICLKETGRDTAELYVMGVLKTFHRKGIGTKLFNKAREMALTRGYSFLQVKTMKMGKYDNYDETNRFYLALGFKEFEVFPTLWDEWNPCQVYVMYLNESPSDSRGLEIGTVPIHLPCS